MGRLEDAISNLFYSDSARKHIGDNAAATGYGDNETIYPGIYNENGTRIPLNEGRPGGPIEDYGMESPQTPAYAQPPDVMSMIKPENMQRMRQAREGANPQTRITPLALINAFPKVNPLDANDLNFKKAVYAGLTDPATKANPEIMAFIQEHSGPNGVLDVLDYILADPQVSRFRGQVAAEANPIKPLENPTA